MLSSIELWRPEYNRKVRKMALIAAFSLLAACTKDIQNSDAVRSSIVDYLKARQEKTGLNVDMMKVDVSSVTFTAAGKEAHANVMFTPKAGGEGMQMPYTLDRKGDQWVVRAHAEGGENPHGASGLPSLPPNHPPVGQKP
jgi:hypothetical protein